MCSCEISLKAEMIDISRKYSRNKSRKVVGTDLTNFKVVATLKFVEFPDHICIDCFYIGVRFWVYCK